MSGWAIVTQRVVVGLSILAVLLLLHSFSLPQHGDSAIGTAMVLALALLLMADPQREIEQRAKTVFERGVALDLAADVADDAAEPGSQEFELSPGALELMGMGIAPHHDGGALGHAQIVVREECF